MRVLGYDPSSTLGGLAVADDKRPIYIGIWKPARGFKTPLERFEHWDLYFHYVMKVFQPDALAMEVIRVSTSHDTTRSLSRFESVALVHAVRSGIEILEYQVGQGRAALFGDGYGTTPKEQVYKWMVELYPDLPWLPFDRGGGDQSDALVPALAFDRIKERQAIMKLEKRARRKRKRARR